MSTHTNTAMKRWSVGTQQVPLKRAPTLYAIIIFKLVKGIVFLAFGIALYFQATHNLSQEWADLLKTPFAEHLRIHPEARFFHHIAQQIDNVTVNQVRVFAVSTMAFSFFPLVEGIGMLCRAGWAGWLAIGESAFFVPIEVYELARKYSHIMLVITVVNVLIVWYLYVNRERLFRHHHH